MKRRGYRETLIDAHKYPPAWCWFCGQKLKRVFTTVRKNGQDLRVHPTCRAEALTVVESVVEIVVAR